MTPNPSTVARVVEPLEEAASIQWDIAQRVCVDACRWYHGPRLYLRAAGVVDGVTPDSAFLVEALTTLAREGVGPRVLISAAADFGTLAHVVAAYSSAGRPLEVLVVDRCATPLFMNEWYGRRMSVPVVSVQSDILAFERPQAFDLICTHSFMGRFDLERRQHVVRRWHDLLAPGGAVVTAHRLRRSLPAAETKLAPADAAVLHERLRRALDKPSIDPAALRRWTEEFVSRKTTHPVASAVDDRVLFEQGGFDPVSLTVKTVERLGCANVFTERLGIVARRPV